MKTLWVGFLAVMGWSLVYAGPIDKGRYIQPAPRIILPPMFSENMVLQRDVPIPVWGWAPDGMPITVTLADRRVSTVATNGRWCVRLPPLPAGGPYTFRVESPGDYHYDTILFSQVRAGEVWLMAGDMNVMAAASELPDGRQAVADSASNTTIRVFMAGYRPASSVSEAQEILMGFWGRPKWEAASYTVPRSSRTDIPGGSSALGWFFASALDRKLGRNMPIGLIELSSLLPVESWLSPSDLAGDAGAVGRAGGLPPAPRARAFLANIAPLAPFPIRGAVVSVRMGLQPPTHNILPELARSWRAAWADEALPILFAQSPGLQTNEAALTNPREIAEQLVFQAVDAAYGGTNRTGGGKPGDRPARP
jgi:sialate O-acetylesterase